MKRNVFVVVCLVALFSCKQTVKEEFATGKFDPSWESLKQYEVPTWFRDAKFGIWAHWGPQCEPEQGDWYARSMYIEGSRQNKWHVENYGHPSEFGFKDVINEWKAEEWNPEELVELYKRAGAKYFFAMGNHHDNLDLWNSKYQDWNSVNIGPHKDILSGWEYAARKNELPFGVSIHSAHAWMWYETSQGADKEGAYKGVPYDANLTKSDGKGTWWNGLDPQELYTQNHSKSPIPGSKVASDAQWNWAGGLIPPSEAYCLNFYNRTVDMINQFHPDLVYFDDTALPLWPVSNVGLEVAAHYYNTNMEQNNGNLEGVLFGKILTDEQKNCMVWDVERGAPSTIQDKAWQTCTCIGNWHYNQSIYDNDGYKSAKTVIQMLADIVSKNGNLLLSIPLKGNGTIDDKELTVIEGITAWMDQNNECIYETRPWFIYGEGPQAENENPIDAQGFNEGKVGAYCAQDIRFTKKGDVLYAIIMECPNDGEIIIKSLAKNSPYFSKTFSTVQHIGDELDSYAFAKDGLKIKLEEGFHSEMPVVFKID